MHKPSPLPTSEIARLVMLGIKQKGGHWRRPDSVQPLHLLAQPFPFPLIACS
jgi:hypothetical protein